MSKPALNRELVYRLLGPIHWPYVYEINISSTVESAAGTTKVGEARACGEQYTYRVKTSLRFVAKRQDATQYTFPLRGLLLLFVSSSTATTTRTVRGSVYKTHIGTQN